MLFGRKFSLRKRFLFGFIFVEYPGRFKRPFFIERLFNDRLYYYWHYRFFHSCQFITRFYLTQIESMYIRNGTAIGILFVLTLIVGAIVNYVISQLVDKTGLSGTDRVLGAIFGLVRGALIVAALLFFMDTFTNFEQTDWWKESQLIPHFGFIIEWFFQQLQASSSFLNPTLNQ